MEQQTNGFLLACLLAVPLSLWFSSRFFLVLLSYKHIQPYDALIRKGRCTFGVMFIFHIQVHTCPRIIQHRDTDGHAYTCTIHVLIKSNVTFTWASGWLCVCCVYVYLQRAVHGMHKPRTLSNSTINIFFLYLVSISKNSDGLGVI